MEQVRKVTVEIPADLLDRRVEGALSRMIRFYDRTLSFVLEHRALALIAFLVTIALTVDLYIKTPKGYFPQDDTGLIFGGTRASPEISFEAMKELQQRVTEIVMSDPAAIGGINVAAPVRVSNGEFSVGCDGIFRSGEGSIASGQALCLRHVAGAPLRDPLGQARQLKVGEAGLPHVEQGPFAAQPEVLVGELEPVEVGHQDVGDDDRRALLLDALQREALPEVLASTFEFTDRVGRETEPLVADAVGQPLVMEAGRVHRLLDRHAVVDHVREDLGEDGAAEAVLAAPQIHQQENGVSDRDSFFTGGNGGNGEWGLGPNPRFKKVDDSRDMASSVPSVFLL